MTDVATCPDCLRPRSTSITVSGGEVPIGSCGYWVARHSVTHAPNLGWLANCQAATIRHLRSDLATTQAKYDTLAAAHAKPSPELTALEVAERAVVEAVLAWAEGGTTDGPLEYAIRKVQAARAKAGR